MPIQPTKYAHPTYICRRSDVAVGRMDSRANQHYRKLDLSVCRVRLQPLPSVYFEDLNGKRGIFLENDFWTPPLPINFVHEWDRKFLNLT